MLTALITGLCIKAARYPPQLTGRDHAGKLAASDTRSNKIPRPRRARPTQKALNLTFGIRHYRIVP
jgi:hypothetical protein